MKDSVKYLLDRLEKHYSFECEGGPLSLCTEWYQLKTLVSAPERRIDIVRKQLTELLKLIEDL